MPILIRHDNYGQMGQTAMNVGREQLRQVLVQEAERRAALRIQQQQVANQFALGQQGLDLDREKLDADREQGQMQFAAEMDRNRIIAAGNANNNRIRELMEEGRNARNMEDNQVGREKLDLAKQMNDDKLNAARQMLADKIAAGTATREDRQDHDIVMGELLERSKLKMQENALDAAKEMNQGRLDVQRENIQARTQMAEERAWAAESRAAKGEADKAAMRLYQDETTQRAAQDRALRNQWETANSEMDRFYQDVKLRGLDGMDTLPPAEQQQYEQIRQRIRAAQDAYQQFLRTPAPTRMPATPAAPVAPTSQPAGPQAAANLQAVRALLAQGVDALNPAGFQYGGHAYRHVGNGMFQQIA